MDRALLVVPISTRAAIHRMGIPATFGRSWPLGKRHIQCYLSCMSATPVSQGISAVPQRDRRDRRRSVPWRGNSILEAKYLQLHTQLITEGKPMSGRCGGYVYYWAYGRLCWRVYVIPKDPRTPAQRRSRAAFGAASKAWSENHPLTDEQRNAWRAEAAKTKSTPRLGQSGVLTEQQHFVGRNSVKERWGLALLWEPCAGQSKNAERRRQNTQFSAQVQQPQRLVRPTWEPRRACTGPAPDPRAAAKACAQEPIGRYVPAQLPFPQRFTQPSSDRPRTSSSPLPVRCRRQARPRSRIRSIGLRRWSSTLVPIWRNAHFRDFWRGG